MSLSAEKEAKRMALYRQGLNDNEIANRCGCYHNTICSWRRKHGLPPNVLPGHNSKTRGEAGVSMRKVLTSEQCEIILEFFRCLLIARLHQRQLDVGDFLHQYREYLQYSGVQEA